MNESDTLNCQFIMCLSQVQVTLDSVSFLSVKAEKLFSNRLGFIQEQYTFKVLLYVFA